MAQRDGADYKYTAASTADQLEQTGLENDGFGPLEKHYTFQNNFSDGATREKCTDHYATHLHFNFNENASDPSNAQTNGEATPTPNSTKALIQEDDSRHIDCSSMRTRFVGEKCFGLLLFFLVTGMGTIAFGITCVIPVKDGMTVEYCHAIGGFITGLVLVCGGASLLLLAIISCVLIHACSGRELHGGKCHINCHIFEDLVE